MAKPKSKKIKQELINIDISANVGKGMGMSTKLNEMLAQFFIKGNKVIILNDNLDGELKWNLPKKK